LLVRRKKSPKISDVPSSNQHNQYGQIKEEQISGEQMLEPPIKPTASAANTQNNQSMDLHLITQIRKLHGLGYNKVQMKSVLLTKGFANEQIDYFLSRL